MRLHSDMPDVDPAAIPTCRDCIHHGEFDRPGYGECRAHPPANPRQVAFGLAMTYFLTADDLPACGEFRPRDVRGPARAAGVDVLEVRTPADPDAGRPPVPPIEARTPPAPAPPTPRLGPTGGPGSGRDRGERNQNRGGRR